MLKMFFRLLSLSDCISSIIFAVKRMLEGAFSSEGEKMTVFLECVLGIVSRFEGVKETNWGFSDKENPQ